MIGGKVEELYHCGRATPVRRGAVASLEHPKYVIEFIPNISDGRRADVIADLASGLAHVPDAHLLDVSSDWSHNRSVFTMVGTRTGLEAAAHLLVERVIRAVDLRRHEGEHPRIGAIDVMPFVPLVGASMAECVVIARAIGAHVAECFDIPVFLYEEAAVIRDRGRLEDIRRGQFEGLTEKLADPRWAPDFGPARRHPTAGAVAIGARHPLVAFNVNLASDDLDVARRIAAVVRERSGGLPGVKALGLRLHHRGIVQVSMNLTRPEQTSLHQAFERVRDEAARHGAAILDSEIIGLVPRAAFVGTTPGALKLVDGHRGYVLEDRLASIGA